ncbi:MAG: DUF3649 domain-containing protein [Kiloniellales bacterium]|nr:DUF3649 domain-containing protein [Kiloniellales bacterium]
MKGGASRIDVLSRIAAAVVGGYVLSAATAVCLALLLPMMRSEAVLTGTMTSFIVYVGVAIWVFAVSSAGRAWIGLVLCAGMLGGVVLIFRLGGAP